MLQRHVNSHFEESSSGSHSTNTGQPKKSIEGAPARKRLKRAGVKLRFRELPFSARIFDYFDAGMMAGIRHQVSSMEAASTQSFNMKNDCIKFECKIVSVRTDLCGRKNLLIKWSPENLLPDEWVYEENLEKSKIVKISSLP